MGQQILLRRSTKFNFGLTKVFLTDEGQTSELSSAVALDGVERHDSAAPEVNFDREVMDEVCL